MTKKKQEIIELDKEVKTSVISVSREYSLNYTSLNPKDLDELYATVPEINRTVDLRGAALISQGYEITPRDDSDMAKKYASLCSYILNNSGGIDFVEQYQKNTDLYGDGYVELMKDSGKITELAHIHPYNFGYELEIINVQGTWQSRIKIDENTGKPVGYASYKMDETKGILVNDQTYDLDIIAHLKYKVIGDALNGVSIVQPMYNSILNKVNIELSVTAAAKLVAAPKIVISGDFETEEDAKEEAKEAASLDTNDVIVLQNGKDFEIVNPGKTSLPELREIFLSNITTATGIPRPILTSEGNDINKATIVELMKFLRENLKSNANKIKNNFENFIFKKIGESYNIPNYQKIIPIFSFPDNGEIDNEHIVREERKAATLTSLSNTLALLNKMLLGSTGTPANTELKKEITDAMSNALKTFNDTIKTFTVNNDQDIGMVEEDINSLVTDGKIVSLSEYDNKITYDTMPESSMEKGLYNQATLTDNIEEILQPDALQKKHDELHIAYEAIINGSDVTDIDSGELITIPQLVAKHKFYVGQMEKIGTVHEPSEIGAELDSYV